MPMVNRVPFAFFFQVRFVLFVTKFAVDWRKIVVTAHWLRIQTHQENAMRLHMM